MQETTTLERDLGASGLQVSAIGLGCWAIGGHFTLDGRPDSYGPVDDAESVRAIRAAVDLGVTFFDTADAYGTGHSEELLGRALAGVRDRVAIATKFGYVPDPAARAVVGTDVTAGYARRALEASLRRLGTDYVDLYQLHVGGIAGEQVDEVFGALDELREQGLVRAYGWSTGEAGLLRAAASRWRLASVQHELNVLVDQPDLLRLAGEEGLATIANMPLAMGLLSGRYDAGARLSDQDVRGSGHAWVRYFEDGRPRPDFLDRLAAVRELLTDGGRTLVQGALCWVLARGDLTVPIPGFKSRRQAEENARALEFGPLDASVMRRIDELLGRAGTT
ncbi:MAG: aldo/keto reductase [Propionicimonas sp.]